MQLGNSAARSKEITADPTDQPTDDETGFRGLGQSVLLAESVGLHYSAGTKVRSTTAEVKLQIFSQFLHSKQTFIYFLFWSVCTHCSARYLIMVDRTGTRCDSRS